jgi:hypothetical protein
LKYIKLNKNKIINLSRTLPYMTSIQDKPIPCTDVAAAPQTTYVTRRADIPVFWA